MAERGKEHPARRRAGSLAWDVAPLVVLAGAGVALLQEPRRRRARARDVGRGRQATAPHEIPRRGWKDILLRTKSEFFQDHILLTSAGVTFFSLLALFPGIAVFVALYGLFADVAEAKRNLDTLSVVLPPTALDFVGGQMVRVAAADKGSQSLAFVIGLIGSVWSANGAMKSLMTALNIAYGEREKRSFVRRTLVSFAFTLGLMVFAITAIAILAAPAAISAFVGPRPADLFQWVSWPLLLVGLTMGLALLYHFGPSRDPVRWKWITWGSAGVIVFWVFVSFVFSRYLSAFGHYEKTYGTLGAAVGFMMWIYLSAAVVLAGAELNSEIEHQTTVDTTIGAPEPMGFRRAVMADTVGAAQGK